VQLGDERAEVLLGKAVQSGKLGVAELVRVLVEVQRGERKNMFLLPLKTAGAGCACAPST
jgi:hypothetical protein